MSSSTVPILPKLPSFDLTPLRPIQHLLPLTFSHTGMWRRIFWPVRRSYHTSCSSSYSLLVVSSSVGESFSLNNGMVLDWRTPCNSGNSMFPQLGFVQSKGFIGKTPRLTMYPKAKFKGFASVAEAIEAISSTDAEEDTSSVEGRPNLLLERSSSKEAIGAADGSLRMKPEWQEQQQKGTVSRLYSRNYCALRRRQIKIETEAWAQAAQEYKELLMDMCERKLAPNLPYMKSLFLGWFEPFRDRIAAEQELCKDPKSKAPYAPYFNELPSEMMAVITMHKLMSLLMMGTGDGCVRVVQASCQIGDAIEQEARIHKFFLKTKKPTSTKGKDDIDHLVAKEQKLLRKKVEVLMKKQKVQELRSIVKKKDCTKPWGTDAQAKVGSRLIELLIDSAYIQPPIDQQMDSPDIRPAFRHSLRTITNGQQKKLNRRYGIIECDPLIREGLDRTARHMVIPYMPMLIPPVNWTGYDKGGHLFLPSYIMRTHGAKQQRLSLKRASRKQLKPVFEALDTLGATKWRINKRVLGIVDRLWSSGGRLAGLVDREDLPLPDKPETEDENLIKRWRWQVRGTRKENIERHSQRCDVELKLSVARKMKDEEGFYYPHNLDFRGRAYPMHPHLNHLGSDLCRGVLEFAEGRQLGKSGLRWLKIHLANLYGNGVDKISYDGRIAFTENHLEDIFDSADRPLEGGRWWLNAEDPFQCLAVCMNIAEALRSSSPETTISHLPVHQDGSCNGLQHYAALGRDRMGAVAVNLVAGDKPADVYSSIAASLQISWQGSDGDTSKRMDYDGSEQRIFGLKEILLAEIKKLNKVEQRKSVKMFTLKVDRKLVKQTVMTSVYGVTYIGAREQIKKRLKERNVNADDTQIFNASCYAAKTTLTALGEMFQAARSIMNWLGDCAKLIAMENQPVRWTTPLGLPVVQPYCKLGRRLIKTSLQVLTLQRETDMVLVKRQRTAFPPNFIHSLDGSHMMMTAVACRDSGLNFAGVHDSYWTHACDVDKINIILREKFVELYKQPILEDLLESFRKSFPTLSFPELPERGDFDLKEVLDSPYFFN
ncbi:hypothetical protein HPP92_020585 [Vanilla planifolia]|uniref:DNA-directed RNA polymerase n=1 Tax=Vanilla planifolia TaxID=51239 RepID=A0A835UM73_VANPL|nr:hypothetical protein HPP92_020585 [Vanilla planifolia]